MPDLSCWAAWLELGSTGKRRQQLGGCNQGSPDHQRRMNHRYPGDELPWGTSHVLPSLSTAELLPELGTAWRR